MNKTPDKSIPWTVRFWSLLAVLITTTFGLVGVAAGPAHAAPSAVADFQIKNVNGSVMIDGWAVDPARPSATLEVQVYDRTENPAHFGGTFYAGAPRPELAQYGWGSKHGFAGSTNLGNNGNRYVCLDVRAPLQQLNYGTVVCKWVTLPFTPEWDNPRAAMVVQQVANGGVVVSGWAYDPNLMGTIEVMMTIDGSPFLRMRADGPSPDLGNQTYYYGNGFEAGFYLPSYGTHQICLFAINYWLGEDVLAQCNDVTWSPPTGNVRGEMGGYAAGSAIITAGWAFDEAYLNETMRIMLTLDGEVKAFFYANQPSPELYPYGIGGNHGFTAGFHASPGKHQVCQFVVSVYGRSALTKCIDVVTT